MKIIDGKKIAEEIKIEIKEKVYKLRRKGINPNLSVILVGDDPASLSYIKGKEKDCQEVGINSEVINFPENCSQEKIENKIKNLNDDDSVHGILVQLPLPDKINSKEIIEIIDPKKDVDCFHPYNVGKMFLGDKIFSPCTPQGVIEILKRSGVEIEGKNAVVVGRSNIVGKPLAFLLTKENATVTLCHSKTKNLEEICRTADILVAAIGRPKMITKEYVRPGAVVIDVGISRGQDSKLSGDVDFENVKKIAEAITPVPGGVGPMTRVMLLENTLLAAKLSFEKN